MTNREKQLITDLSDKLISEADFFRLYPVKITDSKEYILNMLKSSLISKDKDQVTYAIFLGYTLDSFEFDKSFLKVLSDLLMADWHFSHEDIVEILQDLNDPSSAESLYKTALEKINFLPFDDTYRLQRKCIKALASIGGDTSIRYLHSLSHNNVKEIRDYAQKELDRRGW